MLGRPAAPGARAVVVRPDDLVEEALAPEDLVEQQLAVVGLAVVDVEVQRALAGSAACAPAPGAAPGTRDSPRSCRGSSTRRAASSVAAPLKAGARAVRVGDRSQRLARLHLAGVERRIDVDQLKGLRRRTAAAARGSRRAGSRSIGRGSARLRHSARDYVRPPMERTSSTHCSRARTALRQRAGATARSTPRGSAFAGVRKIASSTAARRRRARALKPARVTDMRCAPAASPIELGGDRVGHERVAARAARRSSSSGCPSTPSRDRRHELPLQPHVPCAGARAARSVPVSSPGVAHHQAAVARAPSRAGCAARASEHRDEPRRLGGDQALAARRGLPGEAGDARALSGRRAAQRDVDGGRRRARRAGPTPGSRSPARAGGRRTAGARRRGRGG